MFDNQLLSLLISHVVDCMNHRITGKNAKDYQKCYNNDCLLTMRQPITLHFQPMIQIDLPSG